MNKTFVYKIATRLLRKYQSILGICTLGARALVLNQNKEILLVKHTYQPHWYIPGGGVKRGESVKAALFRELQEEVGVTVLGEPQLLGIYHHRYLGVNDYPIIYVIDNFSIAHANSPEIEQIGWFAYDNLPEMTSPGTKRRLDEYFSKGSVAERW